MFDCNKQNTTQLVKNKNNYAIITNTKTMLKQIAHYQVSLK